MFPNLNTFRNKDYLLFILISHKIVLNQIVIMPNYLNTILKVQEL